MSRLAFGAALSDNFMQNRQYYQKTIREFGIKHNRYVNYRMVPVGETSIRFFQILLKKASHLIPNSRNV